MMLDYAAFEISLMSMRVLVPILWLIALIIVQIHHRNT